MRVRDFANTPPDFDHLDQVLRDEFNAVEDTLVEFGFGNEGNYMATNSSGETAPFNPGSTVEITSSITYTPGLRLRVGVGQEMWVFVLRASGLPVTESATEPAGARVAGAPLVRAAPQSPRPIRVASEPIDSDL